MGVLVDEARWPHRGRLWAHLVSDASYDELHAFAAESLGIPRRAFQGDHYDVPAEYRLRAIALGAEAVSSRELLHRLRSAGLRLSAAERRQFFAQVGAGRPVEEPVSGVGDEQPGA